MLQIPAQHQYEVVLKAGLACATARFNFPSVNLLENGLDLSVEKATACRACVRFRPRAAGSKTVEAQAVDHLVKDTIVTH